MHANDQKQIMPFMLRSQQETLLNQGKEPEERSNEKREVRLEDGTDGNSQSIQAGSR